MGKKRARTEENRMTTIIPKIEFVYSYIYNSQIHDSKCLYFNYDTENKAAKKFISKLKPVWKKIEKKVLLEAAKFSGLKWTRKTIRCYVLSKDICYAAFSDPLSIAFKNYKS